MIPRVSKRRFRLPSCFRILKLGFLILDLVSQYHKDPVIFINLLNVCHISYSQSALNLNLGSKFVISSILPFPTSSRKTQVCLRQMDITMMGAPGIVLTVTDFAD